MGIGTTCFCPFELIIGATATINKMDLPQSTMKAHLPLICHLIAFHQAFFGQFPDDRLVISR